MPRSSGLNRWHLRLAVRRLRAGGVIAYPTEAVYGLGCEPLDGQAVLRLLAIKKRTLDKGLILLAASCSQLRPFVEYPSEGVMKRVTSTWPGATTWLLPVRPSVPGWLTGKYQTLAVRVTAHPQAAALCELYGGPVVSTSANVSGLPPARNALRVRIGLGNAIDYILPGRVGFERCPSQIRDSITGNLVRSGG